MRPFRSFITTESSSPAFTRKHFQMVANVIKVHPHPEERKKLADHHATIFAGNNPRFDKAKFYKAAGVTESAEIAESPKGRQHRAADRDEFGRKQPVIAGWDEPIERYDDPSIHKTDAVGNAHHHVGTAKVAHDPPHRYPTDRLPALKKAFAEGPNTDAAAERDYQKWNKDLEDRAAEARAHRVSDIKARRSQKPSERSPKSSAHDERRSWASRSKPGGRRYDDPDSSRAFAHIMKATNIKEGHPYDVYPGGKDKDRRWDSAVTQRPGGRRWDDPQKPLKKSDSPRPVKEDEQPAVTNDADRRSREAADLKAARKKAKESKPYDPHTDQGDWKDAPHEESTSPRKSLKESIWELTHPQ